MLQLISTIGPDLELDDFAVDLRHLYSEVDAQRRELRRHERVAEAEQHVGFAGRRVANQQQLDQEVIGVRLLRFCRVGAHCRRRRCDFEALRDVFRRRASCGSGCCASASLWHRLRAVQRALQALSPVEHAVCVAAFGRLRVWRLGDVETEKIVRRVAASLRAQRKAVAAHDWRGWHRELCDDFIVRRLLRLLRLFVSHLFERTFSAPSVKDR